MPDFSALIARIKLWMRFFMRISYPRDLQLVTQALRCRRRYAIPADTWAIVDRTKGFLSIKEAGLLYWAASQWPMVGPVLELGSFEGRSTIVFAYAGRQVYAVDAWSLDVADLSSYDGGVTSANSSLERFTTNLRLAHVADRVSVQRGFTHDVGRGWQIPGALLFVDAGHTYADVKGDLDIWTPHLLPGGLLLMHDVLGDVHLDVTRAASELLKQGWQVAASAGSIVAFTRL